MQKDIMFSPLIDDYTLHTSMHDPGPTSGEPVVRRQCFVGHRAYDEDHL
jgi:hypothetical protein